MGCIGIVLALRFSLCSGIMLLNNDVVGSRIGRSVRMDRLAGRCKAGILWMMTMHWTRELGAGDCMSILTRLFIFNVIVVLVKHTALLSTSLHQPRNGLQIGGNSWDRLACNYIRTLYGLLRIRPWFGPAAVEHARLPQQRKESSSGRTCVLISFGDADGGSFAGFQSMCFPALSPFFSAYLFSSYPLILTAYVMLDLAHSPLPLAEGTYSVKQLTAR